MSSSEQVDGLAHLQNAALEMIAAARAFLEVAEKVVQNPENVRTAVVTIGALAKAVMQSAENGHTAANGDEPQSGVEHIPLS
ncbi:MAG TPA: hypothetical protein VMK16_19585 [Acidimicrobiales bacterium]|nr:hypothetical protein [Acidimicrobiales bacterium]